MFDPMEIFPKLCFMSLQPLPTYVTPSPHAVYKKFAMPLSFIHLSVCCVSVVPLSFDASFSYRPGKISVGSSVK